MLTYPEDWDVVALGTKCDITSSKRVFEREWTKSGIPFLRTRDIASFHSGEEQKDKLFISDDTYREKVASSGEPHKGDLLVTGVGTIGLPYLIDTDDRIYFKDGNILWMKKSESFFPQWLYLQFLSKEIQKQITDGSGFTTVGTFTIKNAKKLNIPMPSVPEQTSIAGTLSTFDTYIDDLAELIEKKRSIRDGAINDLLSARTRILGFNKNLTRAQIGDCIIVKRGKRVTRNQLAESPRGSEIFPVYQNSVEPLGYYKESNCPPESAFIIAAGNAGSIGFLNFAFWAADDCYYFEPRTAIHQKYLYYALMNNQQEINSQTRRTSIPRLSRENVEQINILLPCIDEQKAIADALTDMDEEIEALEIERDKMIQIREGAMDDLLTGRVRLSV